MTENQKNVEKHSVLADFGHLMEMLWIPLISQIGRNHQNMWKNQCFWRSLTTYGRALKSQVGRSHQKNTKRRKLWKKRVFSPLLFRPGDIFIFISIYIPAAITCSHFKFRPSPTYWPTVCQPIYLYVCIYIYVCVFTLIFIYIYLQSPAVILSSGPPQPIDLLSAYLFIYMYVYICVYLCMYIFFHSYIFTCNHLQSF